MFPFASRHISEGKVCKLKKALYWFKQSPRASFRRFHSALVTFGFKHSSVDHTMFIMRGENYSFDCVRVTCNDENRSLQTIVGD